MLISFKKNRQRIRKNYRKTKTSKLEEEEKEYIGRQLKTNKNLLNTHIHWDYSLTEQNRKSKSIYKTNIIGNIKKRENNNIR